MGGGVVVEVGGGGTSEQRPAADSAHGMGVYDAKSNL